jgi:MFS family permease
MRFSVKEDGNWRAFNHKNYRIVYRANALSNIGSWVQRIAQDWLVLELTNSGTYLGIISALQFTPFLLVSLHGGAMADRLNKRKTLIFTNMAGGTTALSLGLLIVTGHVQLWHIMVMALLLGLSDGIDKPVRQSFVAELVGTKDMPNAISLNSANFNLGRLIGPALSGLLIALFGTGPAFLINAFAYIFVIAAMMRISDEHLFKVPKTTGPASIKEGLRYVRARPDIFVTMSVCFFMATFGLNFQIFSALMTTKTFGKGVASFGLLGTVLAIGSLSAALFSPRLEKHRSTRFVIIGSVVFSVAVFVSAFMPSYTTYAFCLPFAGAAALTTMIAANSVTQLNSDHAIRGRVMGIYQLVFLAGAPFTSPLIGLSSEIIGVRQTIAACALLTLLPILLIWSRFKNAIAVPSDISISAVLDSDTEIPPK